MVVFNRQQLLCTGFYPLFLFKRTALRAMPVAATMVLIFYGSTAIVAALIYMIPQSSSAANF
jgi:hypothetical protein